MNDGLRRTDPRTFAVRAVTLTSQMVVPVVLGGMVILDKGELDSLVAWFLPLVLAVVGLQFLVAYLRWTRLTYVAEADVIRVESGLLSRAARSIPYERIQDVSLEQKPIPRLFGLVEVKFETGAGGGEDLSLAYLSESEGERLRELVRARRDSEVSLAEDSPAGEESRLLFAMSPRRILTFGLFEFSLIVVAAAAGAAQQFDFLLSFDLWDWRAWRARLSDSGHWLAELGLVAQVLGVIAAVGSLLLVGTVTGLARTALREWGFRLERTDRGLRRRRGLLTRTDLVMPVHRVQALRLGTGILRRLFGWYSLKFVSLASDRGAQNHEAVPFGKMEEITPVVGETGFRLPPADLRWQRSAPAYRVDRALLGVAMVLAIALVALATARPVAALAVTGLGSLWIGAHEYLRWRRDCHARDERQIYSRHGWLAPTLTIASREKLQSVELVQGPLARLRGYADLVFGLAGGRLHMRGLDLAQARSIRADALASMAQRDFASIIGVDAAGFGTEASLRHADPANPGSV